MYERFINKTEVAMTTEDRREHVRHFVDIPAEFSVQGQFYDGLIKNISENRVFTETKGTFSVGQDISFYFGKENITGAIIRVEHRGIGVKFR